LQNRQKILNLLGLAQRAGKLASGNETVIAKIKANKVKLLVLAADLKDNSRDKLLLLAHQNHLQIVDDFSASELSQAIGKKRKVLAVLDAGFSKAILSKIAEGV
jgi:ribosomal protein L7Ae-like RNA K-turn-binding protein